MSHRSDEQTTDQETADQIVAEPGTTEPVNDWVSDWDWLDDQWGPGAIDIWNSVRQVCPVATTERYGRAYMPVTMDAVTAVARDTEHFSSAWVSVNQPESLRIWAPPITSDPPLHQDWRRLLLPAFSPKQINLMEPELRTYCRELIADIGDAQSADASDQYAKHIPVRGICALTGVPEEDADIFRDWIHRHFQEAPRDNNILASVGREILDYVDLLLQERRRNPADDLLTEIAFAEVDDRPVEWQLKVGSVALLILAGIDTTWKMVGSSLWHFGQHPEEVARLVAVPDDHDLWQTASEELLRFYAPVTMARRVAADTSISGCPMHKDQQILANFPAANHDPAAFEDANEFRIDRERNRHVAFGLGIHRCIGSNLARLELVIAIQEWLRAFPNFTLASTSETVWAKGQVRGPVNVPVMLN